MGSLMLENNKNYIYYDMTKQKKEFSNEITKNIIFLYKNGSSCSAIGLTLKIHKRTIKRVLIENKVWIEGRDNIKKNFTENTIKEILNHYKNGLSCSKISKFYGVSRQPIETIVRENKLLRKGVSNGKKINLTPEQKNEIKRLYLDEFKNGEEISKITGLSKPYIDKILSNSGYRRDKSLSTSIGMVKRFSGIDYNDYLNNLSEFKKYKRKVISITKKQPIDELSNFNKRGISGIDGNFHLDHKFSIVEGFKQKISPWVIGNIINLEFIPWKENVKKRTKCSINKEELKLN